MPWFARRASCTLGIKARRGCSCFLIGARCARASPGSRPRGAGGPENLAALLNEDQKLLELLAKQDLEYLKILWDGPTKRWRALARPLGGSYLWVAMPPIRYRVKLPEGHDQYMVEAMDRIARNIAHMT